MPIFQSLASMVAEISKGPKFFGCSLAQPRPQILVLNVVFWQATPRYPSGVKNFVAHVHV